MATNQKIQTTELDFDQIKQNLKTFLQGQDQFSDYDFDGSALSILLDVLAYNTHYNALYTNLAVNEAFLDSASKRSSVVSKAKELGYVPRSSRSATAVVNVTFLNNQIDAPDFVDIPRYTPFQTSVNGKALVFYTTESYIAYRNANQYIFNDVTLKEGTQLQYRYVVSDSNSFIIPNAKVDLSTLRVTVQSSSQSSAYEIFTRNDSLLSAGPTSAVYFVKEVEGGLYELEFGNGVVGKALTAGNVVTIEYIVCNEEEANGARTFTYNGSINPNFQRFVVTTTSAFGGAASEDIADIKWNAPRTYASQNRCVTLEDYRTAIYSLYPDAQSINIWGGEQNTPPTYGDVFISVKPIGRESLTQEEKSFILNDVLGSRRVVTMHPKFVDPRYIQVELDVSFYYDTKRTTKSGRDIASLVRLELQDYNNKVLNKFDSVLKHSALSKVIDNSEPSIVNSITTLKLRCEVQPQYNQAVQYVLDIGNPIFRSTSPEESVLSTGISVLNVPQTVYIDDAPIEGQDLGTLRMFYYVGGQKTFVRNVGTVVYSTGLIKLNDVVITGTPTSVFEFVIKPQSYDVASVRNQIVSIREESIQVTPIIDTPAQQYRFASSRN